MARAIFEARSESLGVLGLREMSTLEKVNYERMARAAIRAMQGG